MSSPGRCTASVQPRIPVGAMMTIATQLACTTLTFALCLSPTTLSADQQSTPAPSPLALLDPFIGRWAGTSEGQPGKGTLEREYTRVLNRRFVHVSNRSIYPPQEQNPKGEAHEDVGFFSVDTARKRLIFRQFHIEGFVNHYVQEPPSANGPLVFVTEAIENIPSGWRARETFTFSGPDEFEEVFELAPPGKPFELYSRARLKRQP